MKFAEPRPHADPEAAARKPVEIARVSCLDLNQSKFQR